MIFNGKARKLTKKKPKFQIRLLEGAHTGQAGRTWHLHKNATIFVFFAKIAIFESTNVTNQLLQGDIETQEIDKDDNPRLNP